MEPSDKAEMGSQLLFGDSFTIESKSPDQKWVYVEIAFDGYRGWIDFKQYKEISREYFDELNSLPAPFCKDLIGLVKNQRRFIPILMGSIVPFYHNGIIDLGNDRSEFQGELHYARHTKDYANIERIAKQYLGAPYLWGGKCHFGIDCSGFVQQVYKMCGYKLPRDSWNQAECGAIVNFDHHSPGDLAYFSSPQGKVVHVGIILNYSQIIHASGEVRIDRLDENGIFNEQRGVYSHKLYSIRRLLQ
jgi:cell wall-associated NlpC family hydrolase